MRRIGAGQRPPRFTSSSVKGLEAIAREVAAEWGLDLGPPFAMSNYSYVAPAGDDAVLKVQLPDDEESEHEADALRFWDGDGAVRLLRHDAARKAMVLERAQPGTDLSAAPDDDAIPIALDVARKLWREPPPGGPFRSAWDNSARWIVRYAADHPLRDRAEATLAALEPRSQVLVHGDFHHHNLLRHGDRWVAIDVKAAVGEPEYDVPSFLWNPIGIPLTRGLFDRRFDAFERAGLDRERMRAWTLVRAVIQGFEEAVPLLD
jgi:streptomycin 6-kinase